MNRDGGRAEIVPRGLGLGCWEFADIGTGDVDDARSIGIVHAAYELGIRHFDTAQGYGDGHSELVVGEAVNGIEGPVFIATKTRAAGREETLERVKSSLSRLDRDHVDLFYIHWPKRGFDLRPMMEALEKLREEKVIRHIGVSNFSVADLEAVGEVGTIDVHQLCYNLLWRYPEREIIPYCAEHGIELVTYSSIAQGLLSSKRRSPGSFEKGDTRPRTIFYRADVWPAVSRIVERMQAASEKAGASLSSSAIQWVLGHAEIAASLVGVRSLEQLRRNVDAAHGTPGPGLLEELTALSDEAMRHIPDVGNIFQVNP